MKANIHPQWYQDALVSCVCGNTFKVGSTKPEIRVEICSKCHPFFTGEMRYADKEGKVDSFIKAREKAKKLAPGIAARKAKKLGQAPVDNSPKTLKEMLLGLK
jgi:large subunit ribosomal protein L31